MNEDGQALLCTLLGDEPEQTDLEYAGLTVWREQEQEGLSNGLQWLD